MSEDWGELELWAANINAPIRLEADSYIANIAARHRDRLSSLGVPVAETIASGVIGIVEAEFLTGDLWQPSEGGRECMTIAVRSDDAVVDIVAFQLSDPDVWYLRNGSSWALGEDAINDARGAWNDDESAIILSATPLDWLRAGMRGSCVLDWTPDAVLTLRDANRIIVPSNKYAHMLRLELSRPPRLPPIDIGRAMRRAA